MCYGRPKNTEKRKTSFDGKVYTEGSNLSKDVFFFCLEDAKAGGTQTFCLRPQLLVFTPLPNTGPATMVNIKDGPQFIPHTQTNLSYTPHDVKWIPCSARLVSVGATASGKGKLEIYALSGGALKKTAETGWL